MSKTDYFPRLSFNPRISRRVDHDHTPESIAQDVEQFLASGREITEVPFGVSSHAPIHLVREASGKRYVYREKPTSR